MTIREELEIYEQLDYQGRYEEEYFLSTHHNLSANEKRDLYCYLCHVMSEGFSLIEACSRIFLVGRTVGIRLERGKR
ncbi:TPA: hypothetical protein ACGO3A_001196 [Streptococcus suis]